VELWRQCEGATLAPFLANEHADADASARVRLYARPRASRRGIGRSRCASATSRAAEGSTRSVGPGLQTGHSEASSIPSPRSGRQNRSVPQISIIGADGVARRVLVCRPLRGLDRGPYRLPGLKAGATDLALPLAAAARRISRMRSDLRGTAGNLTPTRGRTPDLVKKTRSDVKKTRKYQREDSRVPTRRLRAFFRKEKALKRRLEVLLRKTHGSR
jgi:hypothetical protein